MELVILYLIISKTIYMNILEIVKTNSKVSFYLILAIFFIILFYPTCNKQKKNNSKQYKNIFSNLKLFTDYTLL